MECKNCGQEMEEGASFCVKCGNPVGQNDNLAEPQLKEFDSEKVKNYFDDVMKILFNVFAAPINTNQVVAKNPLREGSFVLAVLLAIIYGLSNLWLVKIVVAKVSYYTLAFFGYYSGFLGADYAPLFAYSVLFYLLVLAGLFVGVYFVGKSIFKGEGTGYSVWNIVVVATIPYLASRLLAILLSYITIYLSIIVLLAGLIVFILAFYNGIIASIDINTDNGVYATATAITILYLIIILLMAIIL